MYLSPVEIAGGLEFMEKHTRALRWVVGMFTHWDWTPAQVANAWRFFAHRDGGALHAIAFHQSWGGWWGLSAMNIDAALEAFRYIAPLGSMRHLEGEHDHVSAIRSAEPALERRILREEPSRVLRRRTRDFRGVRVPGFRPAQMRDLASLQSYHATHPGPGRLPSVQDLRRQIERGAVFVLESEGEVAAIGKVVPAGAYGYIRDIFTFPAFRRQGCARRLIEGTLADLAARGEDACLCVTEDNAAALELYLPMGFEEWGRRLHLTLRPAPLREYERA